MPANGPAVLGVYLGNDLSACLVRGGEIEVLIEEERLTRFKHGRPNSARPAMESVSWSLGLHPLGFDFVLP